MADIMSNAVVLLSIHPEYAEAIRQGRKKVEFRKRGFARPVSHVVVYATSPIKKVIGYFTVKGIRHAAPSTLWEKYKDVAGISRVFYRHYFSGCELAFGIEVENFYELSVPIELHNLSSELTPPQSFRYLDHQTFTKIKRRGGQRRLRVPPNPGVQFT